MQPAIAALIIAAVLFSSCQKESASDDVLNSTTSGSSADAKLGFFKHHPADDDPTETPTAPIYNINYGSLIGTPDGADDEDFQYNVADQLGISTLRERVTVPLQSRSTHLLPELTSGYSVALNFNSPNNKGTSLIPFVTDNAQYKIDLNNVLDRLPAKPAVAIIENEENNVVYYSGSPWQYISQLNTAISVMHARGIKVTNGGLTGMGLKYLVYQDFLNRGKDDEAAEYQELTHLPYNDPATKENADFVDKLLKNYTTMGLDYVNFHWKGLSPDTKALSETIDYLKRRTGKAIMTNEMGQLDDDPKTVTNELNVCTNYKLPFIVWYSPDEKDEKRGKSLQHSNGSLTPSGKSYQNFLNN